MKKMTRPTLTLFAAMVLAITVIFPSSLALASTQPQPNQQTQPQRTPKADLLEAFVRSRIGKDHRVEIRFGELPKGTRLKPCQKIEPFMANGTRLWGRTTIGVRCVSGARWSVALPVTVRVFGKALVAARQLNARVPLAASDVQMAEVELSRQAGQPLTNISAVDGQMTTRPVRAGEPLMRHHVALAPTIAAGDPVRVIVSGRGFTVTATGAALAPGSDGQPLRVRTASGKILVGTLRGRTVEISL